LGRRHIGEAPAAREIAARRLANQHIAAASLQNPADVVASLGAVQAQDYPGGLWAVGLRTLNGTEALVERALADRTILRTWPMRGTLHFIAARDARWMLDLLASRVIASAAPRWRQLELDQAVFARSRKLVVKALEGGRQLTRPAVYALLEQAKISTDRSRGLHIVCRLALDGVICFGAREGKQQTFALLNEWAAGARTMAREESLAELAHRYFTSHGPATWRDFAWWSGLRAADARAAIQLARAHLHRDVIAAEEFWQGASSRRVTPQALTAAYLLPPFDEYTVAYKDRTAVLDPKHARHAQSGGMLSPTIVLDGQVAATWKRTRRSDAFTITPNFFGRVTAEQAQEIGLAAKRYGRFLKLPVVVAGLRRTGLDDTMMA
jgi:hypothetical protein